MKFFIAVFHYTPLQNAVKNGNIEIIKLFEQYMNNDASTLANILFFCF